MAKLEKSTITIPTAAAVILSVITIGGGIVGNYWGTRQAVKEELLQLHHEIESEVMQRSHAVEMLKKDVDRNRDDISSLKLAIKPEEPSIPRRRR